MGAKGFGGGLPSFLEELIYLGLGLLKRALCRRFFRPTIGARPCACTLQMLYHLTLIHFLKRLQSGLLQFFLPIALGFFSKALTLDLQRSQ